LFPYLTPILDAFLGRAQETPRGAA
jgi:hypothetical protein